MFYERSANVFILTQYIYKIISFLGNNVSIKILPYNDQNILHIKAIKLFVNNFAY